MKKVSFSLFLFFAAVFFIPHHASAQKDDVADMISGCQTIDDKDAQDDLDNFRNRKKYDYNQRMDFLVKALDLEPDWAEANLEMAMALIRKAIADGHDNDYRSAKKYLKAAIDNCPSIGAEPYYLLGKQYYIEENYADAITYLQKYINFDTDDPKKLGKDYDFNVTQAQEMIRWSKFYVDVKAHPHPFNPVPVRNICTQKDEYLATITPDNTLMLFIRRQPQSSMNTVYASQTMEEIFTQSTRQPDGTFDVGTRLGDPFNKNPNEGSASLTIDNKHLFYSITKYDANGPNTDIYTTDFVDGVWTPVRPIGERVNDPVWWDSQPSVSADGNTLYFASNRPGGKGGIDIWMTKKGPDGEWQVPVDLDSTINTEGDEKSPFIHTDSQTLYFSSTGHPGLGGYDIFYSRADDKGKWATPVNLGIPINTEGDDIGFFVSTDGGTGYFCSNNTMPGQVGGYDVYQFPLYPEAQPQKVVIVKGDLKDNYGNNITGPVSVEVKDAQTKQKTLAVVDTTTGSFAVAIKVKDKHDYVLAVKKDSAAFNSTMISGKQDFSKTDVVTTQPIEVKKLVAGDAYTIHDINFATNSAVIEDESMVVLEEFADYLKSHPTMKISISGHTDNVGNAADNMKLSQERAYAVFVALTQKFGIPRSQITGSQGYGDTRPLVPNTNDDNRAKNRRTEFVIVSL